jgi:hypothetical protein
MNQSTADDAAAVKCLKEAATALGTATDELDAAAKKLAKENKPEAALLAEEAEDIRVRVTALATRRNT